VAPHAYLFGEDASRVVISYAPEREAEIAAACKAAGVPFASIGTVGGDSLVISGLVEPCGGAALGRVASRESRR
jgi:phosphoribosylformylglycinamidine synthase